MLPRHVQINDTVDMPKSVISIRYHIKTSYAARDYNITLACLLFMGY